MSNVEVKIEGLRELERELAALPDKIGKRVLRRAVRDGAQMFLARLAQKLTRMHGTGRLRRSLAIATRIKEFSLSAWVGATVASGRHHILRFLEYGTGAQISQRSGKLSRRSIRFAATGRGIQPRHYMRDSFNAVKERALALIQERLAAYIAKYRPGA